MKYMTPVFNLSIGILMAFGFFLLGLDSIKTVWQAGILNQIMVVLMIASLLAWLIGWIAFDAVESEEVDAEFGGLITPGARLGAYLLGIIIAIAFAFMASVVGNISLFVPTMGIVVLAASIGDHIAIRTIVNKVKEQAPDANPILVEYYTERPHMLLHCLQLFFLGLAAAAYLFIIKVLGSASQWIAYIILTMSILITETIIWRWRLDRLRKIKNLKIKSKS